MKSCWCRRPTFAMVVAILIAIFVATSRGEPADGEAVQDLKVEVVGEGRPVLMIPGLNSGGGVWRETCAALQSDRVQCHVVTLPGFAGLPPVNGERFLEPMRDRLLAYLDTRGLHRPIVIAHSLGGVLALQMAVKRPEAFERLILVDALPFLPAAHNPAATADAVAPMAAAMREGLLAADEASAAARARAGLAGMTRSPERLETLVTWSTASDRATTAQAMFDVMTTDLRPQLSAVRVPTLVLGSWAGAALAGATRESVAQVFRDQYAGLAGARVELSDNGYHFLMWDDPQWLQTQIRGFLARP